MFEKNIMKNLIVSSENFSVSTSDPDQAEQIYLQSIADAKILQVADTKNFKLEMDVLGFKKVCLVSNNFNSRCKMEASLEKDAFRLVLAIREPSHFSWPGRSYTASAEQGVIINPGCKIEVERCSRSRTLVINTSTPVLKEHFEVLTDETCDSSLQFRTEVDLTKGPGVYLKQLMAHLDSDAHYNRGLLQEPGIKRGYGELILGTILSLPHNLSARLQPDGKLIHAPKTVLQAEEYMRSHFNERVTISDLTRVCQCSRKALFSSFRSSREYSPMAFLVEQRLQAARRKLHESNQQRQNVSEIAYECGFTHLGRFAHHYRRRFGTLPSETLKK